MICLVSLLDFVLSLIRRKDNLENTILYIIPCKNLCIFCLQGLSKRLGQALLSKQEWLETVQDFLIKLDIKPLMHLLKISISSLNNDILRLTKIMNNLVKDCKIRTFKVIFQCLKLVESFKFFFCEEYLIRRPTFIFWHPMLLIELVTWGVTNRDVLLLVTIRYFQ